jgi:hypothetical protein
MGAEAIVLLDKNNNLVHTFSEQELENIVMGHEILGSGQTRDLAHSE